MKKSIGKYSTLPPFFYKNIYNYLIINKKMFYKYKNRLLKNNIILICFLSAFKRAPVLFHYLCDLIVYEQFFRNVLLSDCLSEASCCSNEEKIVNDYAIRSIRNEITKSLLYEICGGKIV